MELHIRVYRPAFGSREQLRFADHTLPLFHVKQTLRYRAKSYQIQVEKDVFLTLARRPAFARVPDPWVS